MEDSFLEGRYVVVEVPSTKFDGDQDAPATAPVSGNKPTSSLNAPPMKRRVLSDPTNSNLDRKTSINPFKRRGSAYGGYSEPQTRLSVKAQLSDIRRRLSRRLTFIETTRGDSRGRGKTFDSSSSSKSPSTSNNHSPTSPGFRTEGGGGEPAAMRRAVSPILYSPGHILREMSNIKDEESRRVTEMAFLT